MNRILISILLAGLASVVEAQTPNDLDAAISANRLAEATQMVQALRPKFQDNPVLLYLDSRLQLQKGDFQGARDTLNRAKTKSDLGFVEASALAEHEKAIATGLRPVVLPYATIAPTVVPMAGTPQIVGATPAPFPTVAQQTAELASIQVVPATPPAASKPSSSTGLGSPISVASKENSKIMGLDTVEWVMILAVIGFPLLMILMRKKKGSSKVAASSTGTGSPEAPATKPDKEPGFFARLQKAKPEAKPAPAKPDDFNLG